jgi:hypothetical protein
MAGETEKIIEKNTATIATALTPAELLAIWQQDKFWGMGGSYLSDPYTGIRTLNRN